MTRGVQMRVNLSLNESNSKDRKIIDFLASRYNSSAYIKEVLYQLATDGFHGVGATVANALLDNGRLREEIFKMGCLNGFEVFR